MPRRRRQLTAKAPTSTSPRGARPASAPAQNTPTPVGLPSNGVASKATESRGRFGGGRDTSGGTDGSLAHRLAVASAGRLRDRVESGSLRR